MSGGNTRVFIDGKTAVDAGPQAPGPGPGPLTFIWMTAPEAASG